MKNILKIISVIAVLLILAFAVYASLNKNSTNKYNLPEEALNNPKLKEAYIFAIEKEEREAIDLEKIVKGLKIAQHDLIDDNPIRLFNQTAKMYRLGDSIRQLERSLYLIIDKIVSNL